MDRRGKRKALGLVSAVALTAWVPYRAAEAEELSAPVDNLFPHVTLDIPCFDQDPGGDNFPCQTDSAGLVYYIQSSVDIGDSTQLGTRRVVKTMTEQFDPTHLVVTRTSNPTYTGTGITDIIFQKSSVGFEGSTIGFTWCDDALDGYRCDQQYVRFKHDPNVFFPDRALICHEAGHAVGLLHGNDSYPFTSNTSTSVNGCMVTPHNSTVNWLRSTSIYNITGEW
ncbi:exported hypothetical protein [Nostocoides australiense Ben110]|uniref:Peptidase M10 metallopeptidase domain-containing protein n=1 Tax=Nostocoides australiense Ben110 TaxID=1193182 RepID=W6JWH0_9MICO|nr:hypothetical protein [Tetrasphaera australiensis]CCH73116.1 exported hypothetical protein [Tetrasphaera australiensis Ben110]